VEGMASRPKKAPAGETQDTPAGVHLVDYARCDRSSERCLSSAIERSGYHPSHSTPRMRWSDSTLARIGQYTGEDLNL
jgi:hypothetical protein